MSAPQDGPEEKPFFIGFAPPPDALRPFLMGVAGGLILLFAALGWLLGATQDDPGPAAFRFDWGRQTVTGVLDAHPYPVIHVLSSQTDRYAPGDAILLSGQGKRGVQGRAEALHGRVTVASGVGLKRGALDMIQARGGANGLSAPEGEAPAGALPEPRDLGRWRLTGEICDGKCLAGAMRPGTGLAHKACAVLCLDGGAPPVFVSTGPVDGEVFFLLGAAEGGPVPRDLLDWTAQLVTLEGRVERRGDLMLFLADPASAARP
ncbi:MAG: hypothetical protein AAF676_10195 [Pseudomonadota bacterium]